MAMRAERADTDFQAASAGAAVEGDFAELLAGCLARPQSLTARDRECLASAMRLMCLGLYGEALKRMTEIGRPRVLSIPTWRL